MSYDPAIHDAKQVIDRMRLLYGPGMTADEMAEFESSKAREMARSETIRGNEAMYRDCLEFALAYGFKGTPKYRHESIRSLQRAIEILQGDL